MDSAGAAPKPPNPGEPVPAVPPIGKADGAPLRYGGSRAAPALRVNRHIIYQVRNRLATTALMDWEVSFNTAIGRSWLNVILKHGPPLARFSVAFET